MEKKKMSLPVQIVLALILGIVVGLIFYFIGKPEITTNYFKPFGTIFVNLLNFIVVPVVLLSMIDGIISMGDMKKVGSVGWKTVAYFLVTTAAACVIGLVFANIFLNAGLPEMGIISCGVNNKYGHPHEETLSILRDAGVAVYRTDLLGAIVISSDGQNYTIRTEKTATDAELNPTDPAAASTAQQGYIGNVNSKKFHLPSCANLPAEKNQILFSSYEEAIAAGYSPCSSCIK